jgi:DNA-binding transcriptional MerR regulator
MREYSVDELAHIAGTTVRNVRTYQDRGVLPAPEKRGRKGFYNDAHLARLRLIGQLLQRGYTLGNISELFEAVEKGHDVQQIIGLERAISNPWTNEDPAYFTLPELLKMFGLKSLHPRLLAKVIQLDLLQPDGVRYRAPYPKILRAGAELMRLGISLDDMLGIVASLRANVERVADDVVRLVVALLDRYGEGKLPPPRDVPKLSELVWRLRPLANQAIDAEVSRALEKSANRFLGERMGQIIEHLHDERRGG